MRLFTIDAFASKPFEGNPAAVVFLDKTIPDETLQKFAFEMNLSETAYLAPVAATAPVSGVDPWIESDLFKLRWFTPQEEVHLCGHATLASAHALFTSGNKSSVLKFDTRSGRLEARRGENGTIVLDFPSQPPSNLTTEQEAILKPLIEHTCGGLKVKRVSISNVGDTKLVICLDDATTREELENLQVDSNKMTSLHDGSEAMAVILTLKGDYPNQGKRGLDEFHFVSRFFSPWDGINEDPVTGSAHSVLGPLWGEELNTKTMKCRQCSPRGGNLTVELKDNGRVDITGTAVSIITAQISL